MDAASAAFRPGAFVCGLLVCSRILQHRYILARHKGMGVHLYVPVHVLSNSQIASQHKCNLDKYKGTLCLP